MRTRLILLSVSALIIGMSACKKNNDAPSVALTSHLNVINASADPINFYLNGTRLNSNSNLYPAGSSGYYPVLAGNQTFQIKKIFDPTTNTVQTLFNYPLTLTADQTNASYYYSLFVTGETAADAFSTVDVLRNDTLLNTCLIRFVNASPDAGSLNMAVGDTVQFSSVAFKSATDFKLVSINATADSLKPLKVFESGSGKLLISGHINLANGYSYTFYAKGTATGTGNSVFSVGTTINVN